jgi:ribosomal protein S20
MSIDSAEMIPDEKICLDELRNMLKSQIALARQGNVNEIEALSKQASSLVEKIAKSGILESPECKSQRESLRKLYQELYLALTAQQAENTKELNRVRRGKKTIATYGGNI